MAAGEPGLEQAVVIGRLLTTYDFAGQVSNGLKPFYHLWPVVCRAKLSDMGLSKRLAGEQLSFESVGSGGSSGWQAPEQLISRSGGTARQTNSGGYLPGTWAPCLQQCILVLHPSRRDCCQSDCSQCALPCSGCVLLWAAAALLPDGRAAPLWGAV